MAWHSSIMGGSTAERRIMCPGSAAAEADKPALTSQAAEDGTRKHDIMHAIMTGVDTEIPADDAEDIKTAEELFDEFMRRNDLWDADLTFETRSAIAGLEGVGGTADVVGTAMTSAGERVGVVLDWKFGHGRVVAEGNIQLGFYAASSADSNPERFAGVNRWVFGIVQPAHGLSDWWTDTAWIDSLRVRIQKRAEQIIAGTNERHSGPWCKYCKGAATCGELRRALVDIPPTDGLNAITVAEGLELADAIEERANAFVKAIRDVAMRQAEEGHIPPGWKLVERVARRKWNTPEADIAAAEPGLTEVSLCSPAQAEKKLGKKEYEARVAKYVSKVSSGLALVREDDRRPAVQVSKQLSFDFSGTDLPDVFEG